MSTPTVSALKHAISIAEQIEKLQSELAGLLGGSSAKSSSNAASTSSPKVKRGGKRTMSPATIAKMRAAQQARWAKKKGTTASASSASTASEPAKAKAAKPEKKKRKLSPEGRARIVAALKARHAAKKK